ncbi:hypothetical protein MHU86_20873 [Fragilaria crotonensis]|nr:hypothetical protein MHU86_20873 [Fragilaria crotonensis]
MQSPHLARYSPAQQKDINLVRLFLQVNTLADITDPSNPKAVHLSYLDGQRPSGFTENQQWPRQQPPSKQQIRLWKRYIKSSYLRYVPYWKIVPLHENSRCSPSSSTPTAFDDLMAYLSSLPQSCRRMLDGFEQMSTDLKVWKSFRAKKRLYVATDGGLLHTQGTHGWVISNGPEVLFRCAGPVDGPFDTSSSTRCEISGYASALLFIDHLARFWGIRHKCRFTWICDSKAALSRVKRYATRHPSRTMPNDADLISKIRQHLKSIKCKFTHRWIKGHQDSHFNRHLSTPAKLNIEADLLASRYRTNGSLTSSQGCDHVALQQCSISINHRQLTGQYDDSIRYHVNGYHLRRYLQDKKQWSDKVWDTIDFHVFGKHYCRLPLRQQITRTKFVYDQLPLGARRIQQARVKDPSLSLCPCCKVSVETSDHLLHCTSCPERTQHVKSLKSTICSEDIHPVRYILAAGILHWLDHGDSVPFTPSLSEYDPKFTSMLQDAIRDQARIGWGNALRGFFCKAWRETANHDFHAPNRLEIARGDARMRSIIEATHEFTRLTWLSRNSALHAKADDDVRATRDSEIAEIKLYHSMPHLLPLHDQHYCSGSLAKLLSGSASTRRRWLRVVKQSMAAHARDGSRQSLLTSFFPRQLP